MTIDICNLKLDTHPHASSANNASAAPREKLGLGVGGARLIVHGYYAVGGGLHLVDVLLCVVWIERRLSGQRPCPRMHRLQREIRPLEKILRRRRRLVAYKFGAQIDARF